MKQATVKKGKIKLAGVYYSKGETLTGVDDIINGLYAADLVDNVSVVDAAPMIDAGTVPPAVKDDDVKDNDANDKADGEVDDDTDDVTGKDIEDAQVTLDPDDVVVDQLVKKKSAKKG
jgi:hypothetical protein